MTQRSTSEDTPEEAQNAKAGAEAHCVHHCVVYNSQDMGATQGPTARQMNKTAAIQRCNGILLSRRKE